MSSSTIAEGVVAGADTSSRESGPHSDPRQRDYGLENVQTRRASLELALGRRQRLQELALKRFLVYFFCSTFALNCLFTLTLFCLQGFHAWGFNLDTTLMNWIGAATIGSLGGLMTMVFKRVL